MNCRANEILEDTFPDHKCGYRELLLKMRNRKNFNGTKNETATGR
jgi:hypothetical protein